MIAELFLLLLSIAIVSVIIGAILLVILGRNSPFKILGRVSPALFTTGILFYIIGRFGITDASVAFFILSAVATCVSLDFLWIGRTLMLPLNRIAYSFTAGGGALPSAAQQVHSASRSLAEGSGRNSASLEETSASRSR